MVPDPPRLGADGWFLPTDCVHRQVRRLISLYVPMNANSEDNDVGRVLSLLNASQHSSSNLRDAITKYKALMATWLSV